jgi:putative ABC transport system permease protein
MVITPLQATMFEGFRPSLLLLMGAVVLVLLISCGNVAGLLLARSSRRRPEMATRSALGAGRGRILGQLLTESAVLAVGAGLLGTVAAFWLQRSIIGATPLTRLGLENAGLQPAVVLVAIALPLLTVLIFGLGPALSTARIDLSRDLREGLRTIAGSPSRFRHGIVISQVALSVVLMVGAMLLVRSFQALRRVDPGFDPRDLLTAEVALPAGEYDTATERIHFFDALVQGTMALPGVEGAALISRLPIRDSGGDLPVWDPAQPPVDASEWKLAYDRVVTPGYFEVMRIPLRAGRDVQATDTEGSEPVVVINEAMAEALYPGQDALGRNVAEDRGGTAAIYRVVGIVGNVHEGSLEQTPRMALYHPYGQGPLTSMRLAVRTAGSPTAVAGPVREVLGRLDGNIPLALPSSMEQELARSMTLTMTVTAVLGAFAGVALFLAALGLYGVLAYHVAERRHEIGVRIALGARARDILGMVMRRGFALVGAGIGIGLVSALAASRLLGSLLFQVQARDATSFTAVTVFFAVVAAAACLVPAWRAVRVEPVSAFRPEL